MKTQLKIQMLGCSFSIQSNEPKEHLDEVLSLLSEKIEEVRDKNAGVEPLKIALLACLNIVDELVYYKRKRRPGDESEEALADEVDRITRHLIEKIDLAVNDEKLLARQRLESE